MQKKYYWLNEKSREFLSRGYVREGQTAEQRIQEIGDAAERYLGIEGYSDRFIYCMSMGWISLSSPLWSNFGLERGLPCSCNGSYIEDTTDSILLKSAEIGMMTKFGAGTSAYLGAIRHRGAPISAGGASNGVGPFKELIDSYVETSFGEALRESGISQFFDIFDTTTNVISQSNVRRGSMAAYLPIDHPDILEFLKIKSEGHEIQNLSIGVCISDEWMEGLLKKERDKLEIWAQVLSKRAESGYPYIFFTGTANKKAPQVYRDKGLTIHASNLCAEIALATDKDSSFVCNISSINAEKFEEWKDTDLIWIMMCLLDAVNTEYINKTKDIPFMQAPHKFCKEQRAVGLGILGWHSLLQSKNIPFESFEAKMLNVSLFKTLDSQTLAASKKLAEMYGEPDLLKGYGERMVTRIAIAPTTSSSFILGQISQGIEPQNSNYYVKKLAKGSFTYKNPYLKEILKSYDKDDADTWKKILEKGGSVQHLEFLSKNEKDVFKTFGEISQKEIVIQAAQRQKYIDQSQSLNLMIPPDASLGEVSKLLIFGWQQGIKSYYYQRSSNPSQLLARSINDCKSCEA